jgi:hypothetical protein
VRWRKSLRTGGRGWRQAGKGEGWWTSVLFRLILGPWEGLVLCLDKTGILKGLCTRKK